MAQSKYTIPLSIVNQTSVLHSSDVAAYAKAQQVQLTRDFLPYWGVSFQLYVRPSINSIPKGSWVLWLLDDSDVQNALGYHDLTQDGKPIAKAFVKTDMLNNLKWTVTASHEILETAVDPFCDSLVVSSGPQGVRLWAKETADAVESDDDGYDIGQVRLSNFVLPSWFGSGPAPYDFRSLLSGPYQIRPGGYMSVLDVRPQAGSQPNWTEVFGDQVGRARMRHPGLDRSDRRAKRYNKLAGGNQ